MDGSDLRYYEVTQTRSDCPTRVARSVPPKRATDILIFIIAAYRLLVAAIIIHASQRHHLHSSLKHWSRPPLSAPSIARRVRQCPSTHWPHPINLSLQNRGRRRITMHPAREMRILFRGRKCQGPYCPTHDRSSREFRTDPSWKDNHH
jgi:hypothetical protein